MIKIKNHRTILKISAKHKKSGKSVFLYYYSIKQAAYFNPDFEDFRNLGFAKDTNIEDFMKIQHTQKTLNDYNNQICFSKNKLVLFSKILKDIKNKTDEQDKIKKLNIQRRMIEMLLNGNLDEHIDRFQNRLNEICINQ